MKWNRSHIGEIEQGLFVIANEVLDLALGVFTPDRNRAHPFGREDRRILLIERFAVDAVGKACQHDGPIGDVRQQPLRNRPIVLDQVALGVLLCRPEDFLQIREGDLFLDRRFGRRGRGLVHRAGIDVDALAYDSSSLFVAVFQ